MYVGENRRWVPLWTGYKLPVEQRIIFKININQYMF